MRAEVDVLVVGLGPAGGAAALAAAQAGLRVAAVERRKEIGVPVQCAEFIPLPLARYAVSKGVLQQRIQGMVSHLPSGRMEKSDTPGLMIDRAAFDQALARQAEKSGARLYLNSRLAGLDGAGSSAIAVTPQGEIRFNYRLLVAADGPHSFVAKSLCLPQQETVHTRQYTVPLFEASEETGIWLSPDYTGGYAWLFPKGGVANLGLGVDQRYGADPKALLDALHRDLIDQGRVGEKILNCTGGAVPVGGLRQNLVVGNVLFIGDAAGLTHPITGAGIAAAVVSGELAGRAAAAWLLERNGNALIDFEEDIRDQFGASLERAVARRTWLGKHWGTPAASDDRIQRRGWAAFPEYFNP
jgi:digeranylgeranylglycerophospholipid reductase